MKPAILALAIFASLLSRTHAELFSSSTNFIQTLTVGSNEAIFISTVATRAWFSPCIATIVQSNKVTDIPFTQDFGGIGQASRPNPGALSGPLQLQFKNDNIHLEFQRVQITNIFTVVFDATNGVTLNVPPGKNVNFIKPVSWTDSFTAANWGAIVTLSNNTTTVVSALNGGESFSGPLSIELRAGSAFAVGDSSFIAGLVTYYFTEEFATIPAVGVIQVPAGQSQIQIEKSEDLQNWRTVFFNQVPDDTRGFYRLKATK